MQNQNLNKALIFYKRGCPFCQASEKLLQELVGRGLTESYEKILVEEDIDNLSLKKICDVFGWQPNGYQNYPSKPQIFINGAYINGNSDFYKSIWNSGQKIEIQGQQIQTPNLQNPMKF